MSDLDTQIAALLDAADVPRAEPEKPEAKRTKPAAKKAKPVTDKRFSQIFNELDQLKGRFAKAKKREDELRAIIKTLRDNEEARRKVEAKAAKENLKPSQEVGSKGHVTSNHPDCNLLVRLSGNRVLIVFDEQFFITSLPLDEAEDNNVVLNGKCVDFLHTLDEFDWINEQCGLLGRLWRVEAKVPLLVDYVDDAALKAVFKKEGITKLHEAYLKAQEGMKGVGPKRMNTLKKAYDEYSADLAKHRKTGKSVVCK